MYRGTPRCSHVDSPACPAASLNYRLQAAWLSSFPSESTTPALARVRASRRHGRLRLKFREEVAQRRYSNASIRPRPRRPQRSPSCRRRRRRMRLFACRTAAAVRPNSSATSGAERPSTAVCQNAFQVWGSTVGRIRSSARLSRQTVSSGVEGGSSLDAFPQGSGMSANRARALLPPGGSGSRRRNHCRTAFRVIVQSQP